VHQGYSFGNSSRWTIDAIDLAEKQHWNEMLPLVEKVYERPKDIWRYERAFRYLRRNHAQWLISPKLVADFEILRRAGNYQSDVTSEQLSEAIACLKAAQDHEALLVYGINVACQGIGKGGTMRGQSAACQVLQKIDRRMLTKRIRQLYLDGSEMNRSEFKRVASHWNIELEPPRPQRKDDRY
jgi:hypothetical protein